MSWGRPPGDIPQALDQQFPVQEQNQALAMFPGVPAREFYQNNMIDNVNAVQEDHDRGEVDLEQLQPLQQMMDENDDDMLGNQHLPNQQPPNQIDRRHLMTWEGIPSFPAARWLERDSTMSQRLLGWHLRRGSSVRRALFWISHVRR